MPAKAGKDDGLVVSSLRDVIGTWKDENSSIRSPPFPDPSSVKPSLSSSLQHSGTLARRDTVRRFYAESNLKASPDACGKASTGER